MSCQVKLDAVEEEEEEISIYEEDEDFFCRLGISCSEDLCVSD